MPNKTKKVVRLTESALVDMIDEIVTEAVTKKKTEWIAEQESKGESLLEGRIKDLESKISSLTESK